MTTVLSSHKLLTMMVCSKHEYTDKYTYSTSATHVHRHTLHHVQRIYNCPGCAHPSVSLQLLAGLGYLQERTAKQSLARTFSVEGSSMRLLPICSGASSPWLLLLAVAILLSTTFVLPQARKAKLFRSIQTHAHTRKATSTPIYIICECTYARYAGHMAIT